MADYEIRNMNNLDEAEREVWRDRLIADGTMGAVFPDARREELADDVWPAFINSPHVEINVVYSEGGLCRLGLFWLTNKGGPMALLHFGFLKAGLPMKEDVGRQVLERLWSVGYQFLASLTPEYNFPAIAYAKSLGGRVVGRWLKACRRADSGRVCDGVLIQFNAEGA